MIWFREIFADDMQFLVYKKCEKDKYFVNIGFLIGKDEYCSYNQVETEQLMEEYFLDMSADDCLIVYNETKASLN